MKKLMVAIAGALAMACSAFADTPMIKWFDGGVAAGFPTDKTMTGGTWDADAADKGEWTGSAVEISANDEPLTFTADEEKTIASKKSVLVDTTVTFTPFATEEDMPAAPEDAKAGAIVVDGYLYLLNEDGWQQSIEVAENESVGIKVELKKMGSSYEAFYYINGSTAPSEIIMLLGQEAPTVQTVSFTGDGAVSALSAQCEAQLVQFTIADVANATKVVEGAESVGGNTYESYEGTDVTVTYTANPGYFFAGGSKTAVVNAKAAEDITITTETAPVKAAAKIGSEYYITLKAAFDAVKDDQTITLWSDSTGTETATSTNSNVTLDFNGFKYTFTTGSYVLSVAGGDLTIKDSTVDGNGMLSKTTNSTVIEVKNGAALVLKSGTLHYNGNNTGASSGVIVNVRADSTFTMDGGKVWVENKVAENALRSNGEIVVNDGFVDGGFEQQSGTITLKGGVYTVDPTAYVAKGYCATPDKPVAGQWTVERDWVATDGTQFYLTLADALTNATDGATITVLKDLTVAERINIDPTKDITLDANGKTITIAEGIYAFVYGGATDTTGEGTFTVKGDGTFYAPTANSTCFLWARRGNIVVENGSFSMDGSAQCVYADNGCKATINGGTFVNRTGNDVLNVHNTRSVVTDIQCFGGSFSKDPATGDDYLKGTFVASGHYSVKNGDLYTVQQGKTGLVATIGGKGFTTLDAALEAAKDGDTVFLCADIETAAKQQWTITKNIFLDFMGKTIEKKVTNDWVFTIAAGAQVIFADNCGGGGITFKPYSLDSMVGAPASMIQIFGKLKVDGGTYVSDYTIFKVDSEGGVVGELEVNDGTMTIVDGRPAGKNAYALMNWGTATINGGAWDGDIWTLSYGDANDHASGTTEICDIDGMPAYKFYLYETADAYLPKFIGLDADDVTIGYAAESMKDYKVVKEGEYVTVKKEAEVPSWIDPSDTTNAALYNAWAETYGVTDPAKANEDAFLFNVANTDEAVAEAEEEFTLEITFDDDGNPVVECPNEAGYNGTVVLWGKAALTDDAWHAKTTGDQFFKATLELIPGN